MQLSNSQLQIPERMRI